MEQNYLVIECELILNVSFSTLTAIVSGSFILQFMVISICFGIPFLLFLMSIGQYLGSGFMDMWFISPIFRGKKLENWRPSHGHQKTLIQLFKYTKQNGLFIELIEKRLDKQLSFSGIGIAFMLSYAIISIYTIVPVSWLLVYLRDSFLTTRDTPYKWTYCNRRFNGESKLILNCFDFSGVRICMMVISFAPQPAIQPVRSWTELWRAFLAESVQI